jgi:hypothetical protein
MMSDLVSIRDILSRKENYDGWLYLPPKPWSLDTMGAFIQSDKNADPGSLAHIPDFVKSDGWKEALDSEGIEDIIDNAGYQLDEPSINDLFAAFLYYVENDAFIQF